MNSTPDAPRRPATFLLTTSTATGHYLRVLDIAQQLASRGHRVLVHAKASAAADVKLASAEHIPYERYIDFTDRVNMLMAAEPPRWMPKFPYRLAQLRGVAHTTGVTLAEELEPTLRRERVDCVVYDFFEFGAAWAAERVGIPCASAGNMGTVLMQDELPLMFQELPQLRPLTRVPGLVHAAFNQLMPFGAMREKLGLPSYRGRTTDFVRAMSSRELHIIMAPPDLARGVPLRDNQLFVGPTTFNVPSSGPRAEAPRLEPGTVVVSTTTTGKDDGLFRRVLEAVAPLNTPVLATAASAEDIPSGLGAHIRIERYIPHDTVFPEARALITHGGWGTVGRALIHGLPMLVIPLFGDQLLNASLVERAGLGRRLPLDKATPEAIRAELRALLADEALRARARRSAAELRRLKEEQVAARALERLALEGSAGTPDASAQAPARSAA